MVKFPLFSLLAAAFAATWLYYQYALGISNALAGAGMAVCFVVAWVRGEFR